MRASCGTTYSVSLWISKLDEIRGRLMKRLFGGPFRGQSFARALQNGRLLAVFASVWFVVALAPAQDAHRAASRRPSRSKAASVPEEREAPEPAKKTDPAGTKTDLPALAPRG